MLVFTQYWYWFPLAHCLSLAFTPTSLIALNSDLKMPKMEVKSAARPSLYAYPAPLEEKKREVHEKVTTAVLSIAAKQKRRDGEKNKKEEKMDVDEEVPKEEAKVEPVATSPKAKEAAAAAAAPTAGGSKEKSGGADKKSPAAVTEKKKTEEEEAAAAAAKEKKEPEPNFEILQNPARVVRPQLKVLSLLEGSAYTSLKEITIGGIIMMQHTSKDQEQVLVEPVVACGPKNEDAKEPEAPEPFEFTEE